MEARGGYWRVQYLVQTTPETKGVFVGFYDGGHHGEIDSVSRGE